MSETLVHVASGKVRELFTIDDERLLLVASDRISTFDVVLPTEIPDKGRVLTGPLGVLVRADARHLSRTTCSGCGRTGARPSAGGWRCCRSSASSAATSPARAGRTTSAPARPPGTRCRRGCASRTGCRSRSSRRRRRRRPGTTRTSTREQAAALVGEERYDEVERTALALYRFAVRRTPPRAGSSSPTRSSSSASTQDGALVLADEAFTPDSSRFWPADEYEPGGPQPSFDKQFVRDYCESLGWDKTAPGPGAARATSSPARGHATSRRSSA